MDLRQRIASGAGEFLLFALTPPRATTAPEDADEIARRTLERVRPVAVDGLVLYDIDDESDRNPEQRPFPFLPTMDPSDYLDRHLGGWTGPVVVYRATAKYTEEELAAWLSAQDAERRLAVLVGASSAQTTTATTLRRAQELRAERAPGLLLGAVAIPERHTRKGDEHLRLIAKQEAGCSYFVTQIVYDATAARNLVSDYAYACRERGLAPVPLVLTASVCGSLRTLDFLRWLGVEVPAWIENDLRHAADPLDASVDLAESVLADLVGFCRRMGVPVGVSVESVSIRREEIEASVRLADRVSRLLRR